MLAVALMLSSCAEKKTFKKCDGTSFVASPYGWANKEKQIDCVDYEINVPIGEEVIAFNKEWINSDFNPNGTRIGFLQDDGFVSATWNDEQDCYDTCSEEGDDYYKGVSGIPRADEYHKQFAKPNMPTHWMEIPTHP